ncbi:MAG TPA: polysulfide reductase NrfD [Desulfitobacterium dehalogenans]|uniref:Polysulfide reductase NrfD n=1 Tax=Desulfitobacterium dehalogenans TaxID=36854 RepID=A0A7C7D5X8_9FIRM|nr:polysulfide reductase NrfD [Desulfitobacterium dehalogenans]
MLARNNVVTTRTVPVAGKPFNGMLVLAVILLLIGLSAWGFQFKEGLIVTNMRNSFSWGLYIATFAFFVGIAAGGLIVSSSVYLFNLENLKPLTRIASLSAFACTLGAGAMILPDMGRIDRIYNILLHPNVNSPLVWDMVVISAYMVVTFLSVYVQLLPDWKREGHGFFKGWTKNYSQEEIERFSQKWSKRVAIIGLPFAVLIHTVTALIFATQASRGWWNTAILPPDFIAVAVASGTALVLLISLIYVGKEGFTEYQDAFKTLALIVAGALLVHFFFVAVDLLIHGWWGGTEGRELFTLLFGQYGMIYGIELLLPAFTMLFFFTQKGKSTRQTLILGCVLLFIGVFAHRMMLMFPSFNAIPLSFTIHGTGIEAWAYPVAIGEYQEGISSFTSSWPYFPTGIEIALGLFPFGVVLFVVSLAFRWYSFLPSSPKK